MPSGKVQALRKDGQSIVRTPRKRREQEAPTHGNVGGKEQGTDSDAKAERVHTVLRSDDDSPVFSGRESGDAAVEIDDILGDLADPGRCLAVKLLRKRRFRDERKKWATGNNLVCTVSLFSRFALHTMTDVSLEPDTTHSPSCVIEVTESLCCFTVSTRAVLSVNTFLKQVLKMRRGLDVSK